MDGLGMMSLFAQDDGAAAAAGLGIIGLLCPLVIYAVVTWLCWFKIFEKAGIPGWHCWVPILNIIDIVTIAGRPTWWVVLFLIPIVSLIVFVLVCIDIARKFGKTGGFVVGLVLLGVVFFPILGFGDAKYDKAA